MTTSTIPAAQADRYGPGMCVAFRERNGYDDSDFYGVFAVGDGDGYRFESVMTGSTAYAGGFIAVPDATPDVVAAYEAHRARVFARQAERRADETARTVEVGKMVTVVAPVTRGKNKVPEGTQGEVVWMGDTGYGTRVAMFYQGRKVYMDAYRVRVTGYEDRDPGIDMSNVEAFVAQSWPAPQVSA